MEDLLDWLYRTRDYAELEYEVSCDPVDKNQWLTELKTINQIIDTVRDQRDHCNR